MASLPQVACALQRVLTDVPAALARASGFCRRQGKVTAPLFVQTLVLGWLARPAATLHQLTRTAADLGASVINISAPQSVQPMMFQVHVCAAKAGVDMVTRVLAMEWGPLGIRVNSISPGPIEGTEGMRRLSPTPESIRMVTDSVPLGRYGAPEDIAHAALFLSSPWASYISGVFLPVDGGWVLAGSASVMNGLVQGGLGAAKSG